MKEHIPRLGMGGIDFQHVDYCLEITICMIIANE